MITDDQVVALLREAGSAGPLPRPLAPSLVVEQGRRSRTRAHALVALTAVVGLVAAAGTTGRSAVDQAIGGVSAAHPVTQQSAWLPVWALLLVFAVAGVATAFALRLPELARRRSLLASTWGVMSVVALGVPGTQLAAFLGYPDTLIDHLRETPGAGAIVERLVGLMVVSFALCWIAQVARRALRPAAPPAFRSALWLTFAVEAGYWLSLIGLATVLGFRSRASAPGVATFGALVLAALAAGAWCSRGKADLRSPRHVGGVTLLVAGSACLSTAGLDALQVLPRALSDGRTTGALAIVLMVAVCAAPALAGAALALPEGERPWTARLLAVVSTAAPLAAGTLLVDSLTVSRSVGAISAVEAQTVAVLLVVAAVAALMTLDRRAPRVDHDRAD